MFLFYGECFYFMVSTAKYVPLIYKMVYLEPKILLIQQSENEFEGDAL